MPTTSVNRLLKEAADRIEELEAENTRLQEERKQPVMTERLSDFDLLEMLDAASRDETIADGMLYRIAAERIAEYMGRDTKYWHGIMKRTDKQADRIEELERHLRMQTTVNRDQSESYEGCIGRLKAENTRLREQLKDVRNCQRWEVGDENRSDIACDDGEFMFAKEVLTAATKERERE
jgi:uncharacterized protein (UPF0335 family)